MRQLTRHGMLRDVITDPVAQDNTGLQYENDPYHDGGHL